MLRHSGVTLAVAVTQKSPFYTLRLEPSAQTLSFQPVSLRGWVMLRRSGSPLQSRAACCDTLVPLASAPFSRIALGLALALCPD